MPSLLSDYSSLFYISPFPMWVYDVSTYKILDINQAAVTKYGYSREEFLKLTLKDLRPKEEIPNLLAAHANIDTHEGSIYFGIFTHQKRSGEKIRMKINGHKIDFSGKKSALAICQDVTEEERQIQALKESEERLRAASTIAKLGYWRLDLKGNSLSWSDEIYKIWGRERSTFELNFENFYSTIHPDDLPAFDREHTRALNEEKEHNIIHRILLPDNTIKWVQELGRLIRNEIGNVIAFEGTVQDVTAQKEEEQRQRLLESVITHTSDAVLITEAEPFDEPGPRIVYVNEAFTKMTGYTAQEVIGKSPRILQGPKSDKTELAKLGRALRNWEPCEITTLNYKKNGEEFWINFTIAPVANETGWFTHWIAIERDVTELKNREHEQKLLSQISLIFNQEKNLTDAAKRLCSTFGEFEEFDFVEIWTPDQENSTLNLISFSQHSEQAAEFYRYSENIQQFQIGEGLPGLIWNTKKPHLLNFQEQRLIFLREEAADKAGITALLGLPLLFNDTIVGVMIFGTTQEVQQLKRFVDFFHRLETFIGSEINRKSIETSLQNLFDAIPDIICLANFQGKFLKMNKAGCELLGYSEAQLINHFFDEFVHPEDKDIYAKEVMRLSEGETTFKFENRYLNKKGEIIWLSWTCNSQVEAGVIYASAKNITTEKRLRELNTQGSALARIGSWEVDLKEGRLFWTKMIHELHETDPERFVPDIQSGINFYREDFREMVRKSIAGCVAHGEPFEFEAVIVTAKNRERWVKAIGSAEFLEGKCIRIFGSFQDIHEKKESENRLQSLADNLPGVVFRYVIYPDGRDAMRYVSKGAQEIWGLGVEECISDIDLVWNGIKAGGDFEEVQASIIKSVKNRTKWAASWRYRMPNGELRFHSGHGSPEFLIDGSVIFNSLILDITEEKKTARLLEQIASMARIGSWELDLMNQNGDSMYWSPMTKQILEVEDNYNPTLTGGFEFYSDLSKSQIQNAVDRLIKEGKEFDEELQIITASGKNRWIRCIGQGEWISGKCVKIFGSYQDIHQPKSLELQIREILGSISDAFYALDKDWNFTYFNKKAENLLLRNATDLIGKNIWKEFSAAVETELEEIYRRVADLEIPESFEYLYPGDNHWYELNVYPSAGGVSSYFKNIDERKQSAAKLEKAYQEKSNIIESIADAFFTMDRKFIVSYWNRAAEELIGIKREELIGNNLWQVFPDAVSLPSYSNYHKVLETGQPVTFEDYYGIWLEVNAYPSEEGITVFFRDISLRKEADQRLAQAFEEKNNILESIGDAFFSINKDWIVTYWNKEAELVLGKQRDAIVGKNLWKEYDDAVNSDFYHQCHKALEFQTNVNFEEFYPTLEKWFEVSGYPSSNGLSVYFKDVTLRKQADNRLIKANERFEKVTEATNDAIWDWDIDNRTFFRSNGINNFFGEKSPKFMIEDDFWQDKFHNDDLAAIKQSIQVALENPTTNRWEMEYRIFKENEEICYVIDKGVIVRNKKGKAVRMVGAMTDISDRKRHEEELLELNESLLKHAHELELTNEQLEQFAFIASHDLQEPLRMISSFLDQLKRKYADQLDEKAHQYIYFATDGARRMKQIILDLLEYSRAGKFDETPGKINLDNIIEDYRSLRKKIIAEKSAVLIYSKIPVIEGFRAPLTQVFHCLLDNAIKYSREGVPPQIELNVEETKTEWIFSVRDNGLGIDRLFFDKIFIIFQRLHNREQHDGSGIGLSIVKKQVESWGGKIWLESTPGEGSIFYFTVPKKSISLN